MNNATSNLQFQCNYGKPLVAAREAKCSAKDAEAGVFAMEALHKQVVSHRYDITLSIYLEVHLWKSIALSG